MCLVILTVEICLLNNFLKCNFRQTQAFTPNHDLNAHQNHIDDIKYELLHKEWHIPISTKVCDQFHKCFLLSLTCSISAVFSLQSLVKIYCLNIIQKTHSALWFYMVWYPCVRIAINCRKSNLLL